MNKTTWSFALASFACAVRLAAQPASTSTPKPAPVPASAEAAPEELFFLGTFTVSAQKTYGYKATATSSGTRVATELKDIPQDIAVLTGDFLRDQQAFKLEDSMNYTAGVQRTAFNGNFNVRGFSFGPPLRDGAIGTTVTDTSMIDRVEIVRGPAAALYGRSTPGGVINIITKKPSPTPAYNALLSYASFDVKRVEAGATGPLNKSKSLLYRVDSAYQNGNTFRWFERQEVTALSPSLAWQPVSSTVISLNYSRVNSNYDCPPSVLPLNSTQTDFFPGVKWQYNKKEPDIAYRDSLDDSWTLELQQKLGEHLSFRSLARHTVFEFKEVNITGFSVAPGTTRMNRVYQNNPTDTERFTTQNDLVAKFPLGSFENTVLLGADFSHIDSENYRRTQPIAALDVLNPTYGSRPTGTPTLALGTLAIDNFGGMYAFAQSSGWSGRLTFTGGLRYDAYRTRSFNRVASNVRTDSQGTKTSPQVGITAEIVPGVSVYGLLSKSYQPNPGVNPDGTQFKPTEGDAKEIGLKFDLFGGKISASAGLYEIVQDNSLVNDRSRPGFFIPLGEYTSKGGEIDLLYQPTPQLVLVGAYAYTDAATTSDPDPARIGVAGTDVAKNRASLWAKYTFARGPLKGLDAGAGAIYVDARRSGLGTGNVIQPSYDRYDASLGYGWKAAGLKYRASLNVRNLADTRYYEYGAEPGAPITYIATLRLDF